MEDTQILKTWTDWAVKHVPNIVTMVTDILKLMKYKRENEPEEGTEEAKGALNE